MRKCSQACNEVSLTMILHPPSMSTKSRTPMTRIILPFQKVGKKLGQLFKTSHLESYDTDTFSGDGHELDQIKPGLGFWSPFFQRAFFSFGLCQHKF